MIVVRAKLPSPCQPSMTPSVFWTSPHHLDFAVDPVGRAGHGSRLRG